jgi:hypothetical protein
VSAPRFDLKQPCPGCPFGYHKDAVLYLSEARLVEITTADGEFVCHRTARGTSESKGPEQVCAGWLIYQLRNRPGQMTRIAERLRLFDADELLAAEALVVTDWDELLSRHRGER